MLDKYFASGEKVELHSINKSLTDEDVKTKIYLSKINQILSENKIEIMMPMEQAKYVLLPKGALYSLIGYSDKGLYECRVKVGERYKNGNVYLQVLEVVTSVKRHQRREFYRYECSLPIYCRHMSPEEQKTMIWDHEIQGIECTAIDLGGGGVRFITGGIFDENIPIICAIELEVKGKIKVVQAMGKILSVNAFKDRKECREIRVQFEEISHTAREDIVHYIFEDERKRRSKNNGL